MFFAALLGGTIPAVSQIAATTLPGSLEIDPNAIEDPALPMKIRVGSIARGAVVHFQVLEDCHGNDRPAAPAPGCMPLREWDSAPAGIDGIFEQLDFAALEKQGIKIPAGRKLWLRASLAGSSQALYALFGLVKDPCDLWRTALDTFRRGKCRLGLIQALLRDRGANDWGSRRYEVRWLDLRTDPFKPLTVPGTDGATGVAWLDKETLLVTVAPAGEPSRLLRVPLSGLGTQVLWQAPGDERRALAAPIALPGGRVAFVRQTIGASTAVLSILDRGTVDPSHDILLPTSIHQLVGVDPAGTEVLALSLGAEDDHPTFLRIDLAARWVEDLGFTPALYQAVFSLAPQPGAVISFEDNNSQTGWDLVLVNDAGQLLKEVQVRPENDLMPAPQPNGSILAFLAETSGSSSKQ